MKEPVLLALTNLYTEFKGLRAGFMNFTALSEAQDKVLTALDYLFDATAPKADEEPDEVVNYIFRLINVRSFETMAIVELPHEKTQRIALLQEIINEQMTLAVEYGGDYTLEPLPDPAYLVMVNLYNAHQQLKKGSMYLNDLSTARDRTIKYTELLFGKHERIILNTKEDVAKYIAFLRGKSNKDYVLPTSERHLLVDFQPILNDEVEALSIAANKCMVSIM